MSLRGKKRKGNDAEEGGSARFLRASPESDPLPKKQKPEGLTAAVESQEGTVIGALHNTGNEQD